MENSTALGMNRTGIQMAPLSGTDMIEFAQERGMDAPPHEGKFEEMHRIYVEEAEKIGSVPVPGTMKGMLKTGGAKLMGNSPEVLVDKLGERLAFERTSARVYEAMIQKFTALQGALPLNDIDNAETDAYESLDNGETALSEDGGTTSTMSQAGNRINLAMLTRIHNEELEHFHMLKEALEELGADPTAMTPCADVVGVTSLGILQTVTDPRTTIAQCLNALLTAELTDTASWELLMEVAEELGHDDMAVRFSVAYNAESEHLATVKTWLRNEVMAEAV
jgi:rubrerythrin